MAKELLSLISTLQSAKGIVVFPLMTWNNFPVHAVKH